MYGDLGDIVAVHRVCKEHDGDDKTSLVLR